MTGAHIVGTLLRADAAVTEMVEATNIKLGRLADAAPLPAMVVRTVSIVDRQYLKRTSLVRRFERVSVAVRAANYADQVEIIRRVTKACAGRTGNIGGGLNVSILTAGTGPDLNGPGESFEQTQDFRVSHDALA